MRTETYMAWMFVGFWLLMLGTLLNMLGVIEELAAFLAVAGLVYLGIGVALALVHDRHMTERTRAGREPE